MRMGNITNGINTAKDKARYLKMHAHYLGFIESPDGTRERFYTTSKNGYIVTEYGDGTDKIIVSVRKCTKDEAEIRMAVKDIKFGD